MNLIDLILTICLVSNAGDCRTEHLYFEREGSLTQCMLRAPAYIAEWSQDHPQFRVVRWRCAAPEAGMRI